MSRACRHLTPTFATTATTLRSGPPQHARAALAAAARSRWSSHSAAGTASGRRKVTLQTLQSMYRKKEPIAMITAHDFPSAHVAEHAGMDVVLVGDSLAMVALGMEDTSSVVLDEMILHCRSVARGASALFRIGDLPMGSYEVSPEQALQSAIRLVKEGNVHAVKLEGGLDMAPQIRKITSAGIPVLGHIGLTPQRQNALGGFRVQGKSVVGAMKLLEDAKAVQQAGAFGTVIEAVPAEIAGIVTDQLHVPTIGIGAGSACSGQVLVQVDMAGYFPAGRFLPKFVKKYGDVWGEASRAVREYGKEVKERLYPAPEHTYPVAEKEVEEFRRLVNTRQ
ncbi:hypothetical protein CERZMDRAFT_44652 [Cercospora zeae-maydis SCOH1-5]|uniref:3-methyl-2-oxobutanoate hydroxymethyltransferase n=1 Tax=Cercospora zeae-maydis SCOH1-5 TaxID=717836 RepID=A0A6A6FBX5_9PEZI|nr:hypothetical protein CERZMDRAFT_44652 [Cercospora zeae-maydis SCOH1-5]